MNITPYNHKTCAVWHANALANRCNETVLAAMLVHPRHGNERRFAERGVEMVRRGNWAFAIYLPREAACDAMMAVADAIARTQRRSGLWLGRGDDESFAILRALAHSEVLVPLRQPARRAERDHCCRFAGEVNCRLVRASRARPPWELSKRHWR